MNGGVGGGVRGPPAETGERSAWLDVDGERYERACVFAFVLARVRVEWLNEGSSLRWDMGEVDYMRVTHQPRPLLGEHTTYTHLIRSNVPVLSTHIPAAGH